MSKAHKIYTVVRENEADRRMHYRGLPPELADNDSPRVPLDPASILLIEEHKGHSLLFRFSLDGEVVGDTWHMNTVEAKEQAQYEYGVGLEQWKDIPDDIEDPLTYIRSLRS